MRPMDRFLAVYGSDAERKKLDRVPTFVQGVKEQFFTKYEDQLMENYDGPLTYSLHYDAPIVLGFDAVFAGIPSSCRTKPVEVLKKDGTKVIISGSGQAMHGDSSYYKGGFLYSMENLDKLRETYEIIDNSKAIQEEIKHHESIRDYIFPVVMIGGIFDRVWMSMGINDFSVNYRKRTKLYLEIIKFFAEELRTNVQGLIDATGSRAKIVNLLDDVAYKGRSFIIPDRWEQDYLPYYKEVNKMIEDAGMIPQLHTDGDITEMVPSFMKAGFRGVQGWEGGADPRYINEKFPDFVVIGFGDVGEVLPYGTPEQIENHVKMLMDALKENRHYVFGPSTVIVKEMPLKNVQLFMEMGRKYGMYI